VKPRILAIDDSARYLRILRGLFEDDFDVQSVRRPELAVDLAQASPPDLVILDAVMPRVDGFELCRRLKEAPGTTDVPILILTSQDQDCDGKALDAGACAALAKPFDPDSLIDLVERHLTSVLMPDAAS